MKKILMLLGLIAIVGCDLIGSNPRKYIGNGITEICIDGIVYLIYKGDSKGGITPKINADHYPYTCNSTKQENHNG